MTVRQRRVVHVQQADARVGHGRPKLVAYGYAWVAEQAGCTTNAVRLAAARGQLELEDPRSAVSWLDARTGRDKQAAAALLTALRLLLRNDTVHVWRDDSGIYLVGYDIPGDPHGYDIGEGATELEALASAVDYIEQLAAQNAKPGGPGSAGRSVLRETDRRGPKGPTSRRGDTVPS